MARRLQPHEVPWIRTVHPVAGGDTARLVNISSAGVLIETTARLQPGRRSTVVIVDAADGSIEAHGEVVRTELVSVGENGELVYRTAMRFPEGIDLPLPVSDGSPSVAEPMPQFVSRIDGPLEGQWLTPTAERAATVTNLSQTGCCLRTDEALGLDQFAMVRVHFGPDRSLVLSGTVVAVDEGVGCLLRFEDLTSTTRKALRTELLTLASHAPREFGIRARHGGRARIGRGRWRDRRMAGERPRRVGPRRLKAFIASAVSDKHRHDTPHPHKRYRLSCDGVRVQRYSDCSTLVQQEDATCRPPAFIAMKTSFAA
ncbi:MAG: PilZ domain-containing protein [Vicinamibacterales bacterium]